jgi:hypothetical protein
MKHFSLKCLKIALDEQRCDLFIVLLSSIFLNLAIFKQCCSRSQKQHFLSLAVAVVTFCNLSFESYSGLKNRAKSASPFVTRQTMNKLSKTGKAMALWIAEFYKKLS